MATNAPTTNALALFGVLAMGACASEPLDKSCAGDPIPGCRPFQYSVATAATVEPSGVEVGDPSANVQFHVYLATCGADSPGTHTVVVSSVGRGSGPDGGSGERVTNLLELRDDGRNGDAAAMDGVIDVTVTNPFVTSLVPANADITLRFEPRLGTCIGAPVAIAYRTGPAWDP
jgi:hypothetical protein